MGSEEQREVPDPKNPLYKLIIEKLEEKLPEVAWAIKYKKAKVTENNYKTRKGRNVYELVIKEKKKILYKNRMQGRQKITIATIDKDNTEKIQISVRG
ncbi:MAG: hypothetical protein ACXACP_13680 [Candidatus Hodarchaeales archaeon]